MRTSLTLSKVMPVAPCFLYNPLNPKPLIHSIPIHGTHQTTRPIQNPLPKNHSRS